MIVTISRKFNSSATAKGLKLYLYILASACLGALAYSVLGVFLLKEVTSILEIVLIAVIGFLIYGIPGASFWFLFFRLFAPKNFWFKHHIYSALGSTFFCLCFFIYLAPDKDSIVMNTITLFSGYVLSLVFFRLIFWKKTIRLILD